MKKSSLLIAMLLSAVVGQAGAQTLSYPTKNITVVIPKNPGGGTDASARTLIEYTKNALPKGVMFVPENKPAGNGVARLIEVAKARPDGYKLVMTTVELAMFPHEGKSPVTYADFTPLVTPIADPCSLVVRADAPYKTLREFFDAAKANPGKLKVGNSGTGAIYHLAALNIERKLGLKFNNIPYNEGIGPAIGALVGGHLDAVITTPGTAKSQVDAGALRILGVMDSERFELFPDVPTFKEALGQDLGLKMRAWAVLAGPAKLPQKIADELITVFGVTVNSPEYKAAMKKQGIMPVVILGKYAEVMMMEDHNTYKDLIAEARKK
jgi:tripartite-type tricarboxylate transporter receptor subunit TctC